jgi:gliding motility-associated-like protein
MRIKVLIIISILLIVCRINGFSQPDCETDPPLPPLLKSVSIDTETGFTVLKWNLSQSVGIAGYLVYKSTSAAFPIDTIWDPAATTYTVTNTASKYSSVKYVVASMRLPRCTSVFSNEITSVFETVATDTCRKEIKLTWNNYSPFPVNITGYSIMGSLNGGVFNELALTSADKTNATLTDFVTGVNYCFYIRTNLEDGSTVSSNKECLLTRMERPPKWINADYATFTDDNKISVSFTVDPQSEIKSFILERKTGESGLWTETARMQSVNGVVAYTDSQADVNLVNQYRLVSLNYCNLRATISNTASNIVLRLVRDMDDLLLSWNKYRLWNGEVSDYKVFINFGTGFQENRSVSMSDSTLKISYRDIMNYVTTGEICFYISALEKNNPYNISGVSNSLNACTSPTEVITVPNVFTPGNDLKNDLFKPVLSFTPKDYKLIITDRQGKVLFESDDFSESWDGSSGSLQQPHRHCYNYPKPL